MGDLPEAWRKMHRHVTMSLLKTVVFLDIVQVVTSDDNGPLHLHFLNNSSEDATTNGNITSEWALFVNVGAQKKALIDFLNIVIINFEIEIFIVEISERMNHIIGFG